MVELSPRRFADLLPAVTRLPMNHLFARAVLEGQVDGKVWVERGTEGLCHIVHPYGMTLLLGEEDQLDWPRLQRHLHACQDQAPDKWMQVSALRLAERLDPLLMALNPDGPYPALERHTRANFRFDARRYQESEPAAAPIEGAELRPMTVDDFALPGMTVSPHLFWRDAREFLSRGGGWCVEHERRAVTIAFCSFRFDDQLEIGIETAPEFRRHGLARWAARRLIDQCLDCGLEPVWACRKGNRGSHDLATSLGFLPTRELPYYRLPHRLSPALVPACGQGRCG